MSNINKKKYAQYFTQNEILKQTVYKLIQNKGECLLEPSFGAGHLIEKILQENPEYPMVLYEIDDTVPVLQSITFSPEYQKVNYANFLSVLNNAQYKTIVGNPPYIKRRGLQNIYIDFVEKCFHMLSKDGGEMIMIVPSEFFKQTRAAKLIINMWNVGRFTDMMYPNDEKLFEGASIDVVVFRYEMGQTPDRNGLRQTPDRDGLGQTPDRDGLKQNLANFHDYNGGEILQKQIYMNNGIITFASPPTQTSSSLEYGEHNLMIGNKCDVFVGIVSGRDEIYRNTELGNIDLLVDEGKLHKFILPIEKFPTDDEAINEYLLRHKTELMSRQIRKFNETNWYEWGALRNINRMRELWGRECIYVKTLTRKETVAFKGTVQYFGGSLICVVPKEKGESLDSMLQMFNSNEYRQNYTYAGRFKIGQKQIFTSKYI